MKQPRNTGNQHFSRKRDLLDTLGYAWHRLRLGMTDAARVYLYLYRMAYALVPASTRQRWRCGR